MGGIGNLQTGHLWFITFILICYLLTLFLGRVRNRITLARLVIFMLIFCLIETTLMMSIGPIGFTSWVPGIFSYSIAYFIGYLWDKKINDKAVLGPYRL